MQQSFTGLTPGHHRRVNRKSQQLSTLSTLGCIYCASRTATGLHNLEGENEMNKNQNPTRLKMRKHGPIGSNHNETALKINAALNLNHNETALKVRKSLHPNHNETALRVK